MQNMQSISQTNIDNYVPQTFQQKIERNLEEKLQLTFWLQNSTKPARYLQELESLDKMVSPITQDYEKYYVFYHKDPQSQEYKQVFYETRSALIQLHAGLFQLLNNVERSIDYLNEKLMEVNGLIQQQKKRNGKLRRQLGMIEGSMNSSEELINDFTEMYNLAYLQNWSIFFSILIAIYTMNRVYNS